MVLITGELTGNISEVAAIAEMVAMANQSHASARISKRRLSLQVMWRLGVLWSKYSGTKWSFLLLTI